MKLSIIMPCWNTEDYIKETVNSILPQLTSECELILIDDCSTDTTKDKIKELIKDCPYATLYEQVPNGGVSNARNIGINNTTGKYIAFIDSDDLATPIYIKEVLTAIESNKDIYLLSWEMFGAESAIYYARRLPDWNCSVWSRIWKREILTHLFDTTKLVAEDHDFIAKNFDPVKHTLGYIDKPIYKYRGGRIGSLCNVHYGI